MTQPTIRRIVRARDKRADMLMQESIDKSDAPPVHAESHHANAEDSISPSDIGAETPQAAQQKADTAEDNSKAYTNEHENKSNPHSGSQPVSAGENRPSGVPTGFMHFDTNLSIPIWWSGSDWIDSQNNIV